MITTEIKLIFNSTDIVAMFRSVGIEPVMRPIKTWFADIKHPDGGTEEEIQVWTITDPSSGDVVRMDVFFKRYMEVKKKQLFLQPEKLEVYNIINEIVHEASI